MPGRRKSIFDEQNSIGCVTIDPGIPNMVWVGTGERRRALFRIPGRRPYGPTPTHRRSLEFAQDRHRRFPPRLRELVEVKLPAFEKRLEAIGAPWAPGKLST